MVSPGGHWVVTQKGEYMQGTCTNCDPTRSAGGVAGTTAVLQAKPQATTQAYTTQYCGYHTCNPTQSTLDLATSLTLVPVFKAPVSKTQYTTPYPSEQETAPVQCCTGPLHSGTSSQWHLSCVSGQLRQLFQARQCTPQRAQQTAMPGCMKQWCRC